MSKKIYLTIDDFPSQTSPQLLELLKSHAIPALFLGIGKNLKHHRQFALQAIQDGFLLGNHSFSHPHFSQISARRARREILKSDQLLEAIYTEAGQTIPRKFFRFPYGDKADGRMGKIFRPSTDVKRRRRKIMLQKYLAHLGYQAFKPEGVTYKYYNSYLGHEVDLHWTLDSCDWKLKYAPKSERKELQNWLIHELFAQNPPDPRGPVREEHYGLNYPSSDEILLLHDDPSTLDFTARLLDELLDRGLQFGEF